MDILEGLEQEKADAIKEHFTTLIEAERNKGIETKKKVNSEAEGLRTRLRSLEGSILDAGFSIPEIEKDGQKVYDFQALSESLKQTSEKSKKAPESDLEITNLRNQLKENETKLNQMSEFEKKWMETTEKVKRKTLENELSKAFDDESGNPSIFGKSEVIKNLIYEGRVDLDENEEVVWKDGENKLDLKTGKQKFLEERKDLIKVTPKSGSGGSGSGGQKTEGLQALRDKNKRILNGI